MGKIFDILLNSKYNAKGTTQATEQLSKIGKTAQQSALQVQTVFDRLEAGGMKLARAGSGFSQLGQLFGVESLANLGQLVGGVGALTNGLGEMATVLSRIASIPIAGPLAILFGSGVIAREINTGASNAAGLATIEQVATAYQRAQTALDKMSPETKAQQLRELSNAIEGMTNLEKVNAINSWAAAIESGILDVGKPTALGVLLNAGKDAIAQIDRGLDKLADSARKKLDFTTQFVGSGFQFAAGLKSIEDQLTGFRTGAATQRRHLLENIAIAEGRRLQDIARQSAQQLKTIDQERIEALRTAAETYAATIASIDQSSAADRVRIEEDYQERIRQIKEGSGASIEDAIERRDARALAKALQSQAQQLNQVERDHDRQIADNAQAAEQQKAQAAQAYAEQQRAADEAARKAIETMRESDRLAADDRQINTQRALQDFDLAKLREQQALAAKLHDQNRTLQSGLNTQLETYKRHIRAMTAATNEAISPNSTFIQALDRRITTIVGDLLGLAQ